MARENYPTGNDVAALLSDAGLTYSGLDANSAALAGRERVESETGRVFLAVAGTRVFDPPTGWNGVLDLGADLLSLTSISYDGTAFAAGTDYRLVGSAPHSLIRFARRWSAPLPFSLMDSVSIVGVWGYGTSLPEEVWQAMRAAAVLSLLPAIERGLTGGLIEWADEDTREKYGDDPLGTLAAGWQSSVDGVLSRYRRVAVG